MNKGLASADDIVSALSFLMWVQKFSVAREGRYMALRSESGFITYLCFERLWQSVSNDTGRASNLGSEASTFG